MQKPLNEPVKYDADTTSVFFPGPEAHGPAELGEDASTIRTLGAMQRDEVKGNVILSTTKLRSFFIVVK